MIEINLIPDVKQELLRAQRMRAVVISSSIFISIVAGVVVVLLALYVFGFQAIRDVAAEDAIKKQSTELSKVEDLSEMLTVQNQLARIDELSANKKMTSRLFDVLAGVLPPEPNAVKVSNVAVDTDLDTIRIEGQTRAYDSMEVFKKTLDNAVILYTKGDEEPTQVKLAGDISASDISFGDSDGTKVLRFNITFKYDEVLFSPEVAGVTVKLNINGNVTDSYLGIPKSIFTERAKDIEE